MAAAGGRDVYGTGLDYYKRRIERCNLRMGQRVGIGNGREGEIVAFGPWVQGVCVRLAPAVFVWQHYEDVIPRDDPPDVRTFMVICHKCDHGFLCTGSPDAITCPKCGATGKRKLD